MPYITLQTASYDRLDRQMTVFNVGANWMMNGNISKVSLDYQNRPVYSLVGNDLIKKLFSAKGRFFYPVPVLLFKKPLVNLFWKTDFVDQFNISFVRSQWNPAGI